MEHKLLHPSRVFALFKYAVYLALVGNLWSFFQEDWKAGAFLIDELSGWHRFVQVYAQTIDSAAWCVLLLMFELETSYLSDRSLRQRRVKWTLHGLRGICALVILNSVIGYTAKFLSYTEVQRLAVDACTLVNSNWSLMTSMDEFVALGAGNCASLAGDVLLRLDGAQIIARESTLLETQQLALVDMVNACAWVMVVILLEADVRLQLMGALTGMLLRLSALLKFITYAVLLAAAVYWGFAGTFLDFSDAFLWLVAFVFIELNLFQWHEQGEQSRTEPARAS
jgi:hypothetical protein